MKYDTPLAESQTAAILAAYLSWHNPGDGNSSWRRNGLPTSAEKNLCKSSEQL
jgi:hypothetical protein